MVSLLALFLLEVEEDSLTLESCDIDLSDVSDCKYYLEFFKCFRFSHAVHLHVLVCFVLELLLCVRFKKFLWKWS